MRWRLNNKNNIKTAAQRQVECQTWLTMWTIYKRYAGEATYCIQYPNADARMLYKIDIKSSIKY